MVRKSIIVIILIILLILTYFLYNFFQPNETSNIKSTSSKPIPINYTNIEQQLAKNNIVQSIPSEKIILLRFYNFNSGARNWENSYLVSSKSITKINNSDIKEEDYEIIILLDSKYLNELNTGNFCSIIKKANENGDLDIETKLSSVELGWKFRNMYQFKDCF